MQQVLHNRVSEGKITEGDFKSKIIKRKNVSYNNMEDYIQNLERKLMKKYRLGFSGLHKMLVLKAGQQEYGQFYI